MVRNYSSGNGGIAGELSRDWPTIFYGTRGNVLLRAGPSRVVTPSKRASQPELPPNFQGWRLPLGDRCRGFPSITIQHLIPEG
jgi:hypothetical protein